MGLEQAMVGRTVTEVIYDAKIFDSHFQSNLHPVSLVVESIRFVVGQSIS